MPSGLQRISWKPKSLFDKGDTACSLILNDVELFVTVSGAQLDLEYLLQKLLNAMTELEELKPAVQQKINELDKKHAYQVNGCSQLHQNNSLDWSPVKKQTLTNYDVTKVQLVLHHISINYYLSSICHSASLVHFMVATLILGDNFIFTQ
jgi:hypothetical protein